MEFLIKGGQLILSLSLLVILHEFGHYFFARLFKTRVEKFYLFFDPWFSLFKFKKGETEYGVGWVPLGGYVKISGMIDESMDKEQMKQPAQPWEFRAKPSWQRLLIMIGGVVLNFIAAIVIFWMLLFSNGEQYIPVDEAKYGLQFNPIVKELGLQDGDLVLNADTIAIEVTSDLTHALLIEKARTLTVKRNDSIFILNVPEDFSQKILGSKVKMIASIRIPFVIDSIIPGMPAADAGFRKGDSIISLNGTNTAFFHLFVDAAEKFKGQNVSIRVKRDTSFIDIACKINEEGKIGIGNKPIDYFFNMKTITYDFWEALPAGIQKGWDILINYAKQLKLIFTKEGVQHIGGFGAMGSLFPATWDWDAFWHMTALISVILAFMNILPVPALDGGHVMFLLYEIVTRRKPSEKFMEYAQIAGMVLLFTLLLYANGNDIFKFFFNK